MKKRRRTIKAIEKQIAARLISNGSLVQEDLENAIRKFPGEMSFIQFLLGEKVVSRISVAQAEAEVNGFEWVDPSKLTPSNEALELFDEDLAWRKEVLPLSIGRKGLVAAAGDPYNVYLQDELKLKFGIPVQVRISERRELRKVLRQFYGEPPQESRVDIESQDLEAPVQVEEPAREPVAIPVPKVEHDRPFDERPTILENEKLPGQGEDSHRQFQRRLRELQSPADSSPGISHMETVIEDEAYFEREEALQKTAAMEADGPAEEQVERILSVVSQFKALEAEISPAGSVAEIRLRLPMRWQSLKGYPIELHEAVVGRLITVAGAKERPEPDAQILLRWSEGELPALLQFQNTRAGLRLLLTFPTHQPLFQDPFLHIGLPESIGGELETRLNRFGGGILLISSPAPTTVERLTTSLLALMGHGGNRAVLSLETDKARDIADVVVRHCPTQDALAEQIEMAGDAHPDILGIRTIGTDKALRLALETAASGTTVVAGTNAARIGDVIARLKPLLAAEAAPPAVVLGVLHVEETRVLCSSCSRSIDDRDSLPAWARSMGADFYEAVGCKECRGTGYLGNGFLVEFHRPTEGANDGSFEPVLDRMEELIAASLAGRIDPRQHPTP